jgi:hypothetical protein
MRGAQVDLVGRADPDQLAEVHDADVIGEVPHDRRSREMNM